MSELAAALVEAQSKMPAVSKDAENPHFRNKFASLDHIIELTRPVLNANGLSIHQFPSVSDLGAPTLVTVLSHVSGERLEYAAPLFLQGQDMQKYGAALTYARRYAWAAALGIANDEDDDGNTASAKSETGSFIPPERPSNGAVKTISEAQQKRLWAIARERGVSDDEVKVIVKTYAEVESTKEIPVDKYDRVIDEIQVPF